MSLDQVSSTDLGGCGDGMQLAMFDDVLYVGHLGESRAGTSIMDVSNPAAPRLVRQLAAPEHAHTHKVQVADGLLLVNHEAYPYRAPAAAGFRGGFAIHSLADPLAPEEIGFWECGGRGVHRMVFTGGRYVYLSFTPPGRAKRIWGIVDIEDPQHPREVSRWAWDDDVPDQRLRAQYTDRHAAHHALINGSTAFLGFGDGNLVLLDVLDPNTPRFVGHCGWAGRDTHTCLPLDGGRITVVTDEQIQRGGQTDDHRIRIVDTADQAEPKVLAVIPPPSNGVIHSDLRYGPHCLHENQPGSYQSDRLVFATYFSAGLRVYDVSNPRQPVEIAHWMANLSPGPQANDVFVRTDCLIAVSDRTGGGVALLRPTGELAQAMERARR